VRISADTTVAAVAAVTTSLPSLPSLPTPLSLPLLHIITDKKENQILNNNSLT
jgi:hypothetical protein